MCLKEKAFFKVFPCYQSLKNYKQNKKELNNFLIFYLFLSFLKPLFIILTEKRKQNDLLFTLYKENDIYKKKRKEKNRNFISN